MKLIPLPAFQDNDLWVLHDGRRALVVDPGDAPPVLACLQRDRLQLEAILVTHHHADHIGGLAALRDGTGATVYSCAVEPGNDELINDMQRCEELRARRLPTLTSTMGQEQRINPFVRTRLPAVAQAARAHDAATPPDDVAVFATIRQRKNEFK